MRNRWSGTVALMAMGLMSACQIFAPAAIQQAATVRLKGSVLLPAKQIVVGYRVQEGTALVEKPGVGAVVRLVTRDGQSLAGLAEAKVDAAGNFAFQQEVPEGLYLAVASYGEKTRVMAFVRLKAGTPANTVLTAASTMVANRLGRTRLKLTGLQQPEFDEIVVQARSMMVDADVPDLGPEGISGATDAFLAGHQVVKERIAALLMRLAQAEGLSDDPSVVWPVTPTPTPETSPTPSLPPDPVYTPVPSPSPTSIDLATASTLAVLAGGQTDSTPFWVETEGAQFLWVSCPAANSIMRFDRARTDWSYSRPTTNLLADRFVPGQLAVDESVPSAPVVWVGNQRSDGTRVARYDQWGNFLGSVEAGPAPAVLALDTDATGRKLWIGVTGDDSGKVVVADTSGRVLSMGNVKGKPFRLIGGRHTFGSTKVDFMWIATPQAFYSVPVSAALNPAMSLSANEVDLSAVPGELRACTVVPASEYVYVVKQDAGFSRATLARVHPQTHAVLETFGFDTTARIVGLLSDYNRRLWVATEKEVVRFDGADMRTFSNTRDLLGIFPGQDYTFWSIHEGSPQLLKRSYGD